MRAVQVDICSASLDKGRQRLASVFTLVKAVHRTSDMTVLQAACPIRYISNSVTRTPSPSSLAALINHYPPKHRIPTMLALHPFYILVAFICCSRTAFGRVIHLYAPETAQRGQNISAVLQVVSYIQNWDDFGVSGLSRSHPVWTAIVPTATNRGAMLTRRLFGG